MHRAALFIGTRFDAGGHELLGMHFFNLLELCVGQVGLACLDSLIHIFIKQSMENQVKDLRILVDTKSQDELNKLDDLLGPPMSIPLMGLSSYKQMVKMFHSSWGPLVKKLATIGQLQLVRNLISFKMRSACKIKANTITSAVAVLVYSLHMQKRKCKRGAKDQTVQPFHHNIKEQQKFCGLLSPLEAIYVSEDPPMFLTRLLPLFSISQLSRYVLDVHLDCRTGYIQFMVQYIRTAEAALDATSDTHKRTAHSSEAPKVIFVLLQVHGYLKGCS